MPFDTATQRGSISELSNVHLSFAYDLNFIKEMKRLCSQIDENFNYRDDSSAEVAVLLNMVPRLRQSFDIKSKVGEGTFSSVYLARLRGSEPRNKCVALKHLIPTIQPNKIMLELQCLQKFGGRHNVMGLMTCIREGNHTVIVMPYFPNTKFVDFFSQMTLEEIVDYMKNLLDALAFIHRSGIIHRDVKPSNFLYNRKLRRYALVDFGLAQKAPIAPPTQQWNRVLNVTPSYQNIPISPEKTPLDKAFVKLSPSNMDEINSRNSRVQVTISGSNENSQKCKCHGYPLVCRNCLGKPVQAASRAGTPGYRPPEVLLKHPNQTTALDVWAAGVISLSLLSGRYPFFYASDDLSALSEITTIFGTQSIINSAAKIGKIMKCTPSVAPVNLQKSCEALRHKSNPLNKANQQDAVKVFAVLNRLLDVDGETRITAADALEDSCFKK